MKNLAHIASAIAEAMSVPRPREQRRLPAPPDRLPSRRGGRSSPYTIVAVAVIGVAWLAPTAVEAQTGPDLVVESPSVTDSTPTSGTTFTLSATVRNAGDGASAATTLRFYRSTDSTITTSDTVQGINAETVTGLAASESSSSHSLDILAPPAPVQFYYGACVTAVADESDTTNNCSGSVRVRVQAQTPDPVWSAIMTVGTTNYGPGYDVNEDDGGSLTDDDFEYSSTTYTVELIELDDSYAVSFRVDTDGLPEEDTLTLEIDGLAFPFEDRRDRSKASLWEWDVPEDLSNSDLPIGSQVVVCLRTATQVCPTEVSEVPSALSVADVSAEEGEDLTFTVALSPPSTETVTVDWATSGGTATSGIDFTAGTGTLTFTADVTEQTFTVATIEDVTDQSNETFTVTLSNATNATIAGATATGTIKDDDAPPLVAWFTVMTVAEVFSGPSHGYSENNGGELADADFQYGSATYTVKEIYVRFGDVSFRVDKSGLPQDEILTLVIDGHEFPFEDRRDSSDESLWKWAVPEGLNDPVNDLPVGNSVVVCLRNGTGVCPARALTVTDVSAEEGEDLTFTATLWQASTETVTVDWATSEGTATSGTDFTAGTGTLTFTAGVTEQTVTVATIEDMTDEDHETFTVTLSNPTSGTITGAPATGIIVDDDGTSPVWSATMTVETTQIGGYGYEEKGRGGSLSDDDFAYGPTATTYTTYVVRLVVVEEGFGVSFVVDTAGLPLDNTLTLEIDGHKFPFEDRNVFDSSATYLVWAVPEGLNDPENDLPIGSQVVVCLRTGEQVCPTESIVTPPTLPSAAVSFGAGSYSVDEGGTVEVTVLLDAAPGREVVVPVSAAGAGGATPQGETGADWSGVPESVTFGATDTEQTFTLAATDDTDVDAGESVALSFGTLPAGVTAGTPSEATVTIVDNDPADAVNCTLDTGDLWCGEVTVGTSSDGVGFVAADTDTDPDVGALTDNNGDQTITIGSDSYTISSLLVRNSPAGALAIELDTKFPPSDVATLEFYIGTSTKPFKVSEATAYAIDVGYFWTDSDLTWTDGGPDVTLRLRRAAELSVANAEASEGDPVEFTVTLSPAAAENVTVNWATSVETGDTATADTDFTAASGALSITAGQTTATIAVQTTEDTTDEANEIFTVTLSNPTNATLATDPTATGTIGNDDQPEIGFKDEGSVFVIEGTTRIFFPVVLDRPGHASITVQWETVERSSGEPAVADVDYIAASGMLTFAPGETEKTIAITVIDDTILESLESFEVRLSGTDDAIVTLGRSSVLGRIIDRDKATIAITEETTVDEDAGTVTLTLSASAPATIAYLLDYRTADGTAAAGADYTAASGQVSFPAGATERTITIVVLEDDTDEDQEDFEVQLHGTSDGRLILPDPARVLIEDNDDPPTVSVGDATATEGDDAVFTAALSEASGWEVTVGWATSVETGDTATEGTDFTAASGTLTFMPDETTATFAVQTTEDTTDEDNETFTVMLSNAINATLAADPTAKGTITDAALPVVTIAADENVVFEEDGSAGFTLSRTGPTTATLMVTVAVTTQEADRDLLPDGAAAERTVEFAENSATAALMVELEDNDLDEAVGDLTVEVQAGSGYTVGDPGSATVSVADRDTGRPTPANLTALPGAGAGEVVLSWDAHAPRLQFTRHQYRYKTDGAYLDAWTDIPNSGQHESNAGDGSNLTGYTVTGLAGGQLHTFQVRTFDDSDSSDPSDEATATPRSAVVSFGAGSYSVDEGGTVEVTVQLDAAPGREVTVPVSAAGAGGATPPGETGADWSGVPESVTFGATDTEQTFTLAATDDTDVDAGESVALSFGTLPAGVTAGTPSRATVTIVDNDVLPTLSVANAAAAESDGVAFTVTLSAAATDDVTVTWTASIETGDSAEAADFGSPLTEMVTFTPSQTAVTITVPTIDDTADEDNDTFTLTLSSPSANATLASDATATGTITDNDDPPTISVEDQTVVEGDQDPDSLVGTGFPFRVTLSEASEKRVRYKVRRVELASDTATDADLSAGSSFGGNESILPGNVVHYFEADNLRNDDLDEPDETFTLEIHDFENATAGAKTRSTITIEDDDDPPSVSVGDATATEGAPVEFPVTLSAASGREVAVNWATTDDSATSPADFTAASGTLTIMPGETTATVAVATEDDDLDEPDEETFTLTLSSPSNATLGEATATGTITDNDDPPTLGVADAAATEGAPVEFPVTLSAAATADVTATWTASTIEGDEEKAVAADLESTTGSVTVPKGETTATFTVATAEDALDENNETFTVALSSPSSNATLAADATTATGTITDDDARPALIIADKSAPEDSNVEFTVTLTPASGRTVTVAWGTFLNIGQTAEEEDFTSFPQNGFMTFPPGQTTAQFEVGVVDDELVESDETFEVTLGSASNARLEDNSAIGTIVDNDVFPNAAPAFTSSDTFTPAENQTAVGTVRASDSDGDAITGYALSGGADRALFSINDSGVLTFQAAPNYENPQDANTDNAYVVVVRATSGKDARVMTADQTITVTVMDDDTEAPAAPDAPSVSPASVTSLNVNWSVPDNAGPEITDYDVQYRAGTSGPWSDGSHIGTALTAILTGLEEDTEYDVQVRATNAEGTGGWSASGRGETDANAAPSFTSSATFNPAENQTTVGTVAASDSDTADEVTDYALSGGTDQALFSIVSTSGVLTFQAAPNYEDPQDANTDNAYVVVVQATSGTGDREQTGTQTITVTVMDVNTEAPAAPGAPSVSPASVTSLTVTWLAPDNDGPAITDYDVQYRAGTSGAWSDGSHIGTALTAMITGLLEDTEYDVQVRATNAEGTGGWSASGRGATDANAAPSFTSSATFGVEENGTAVGTVRASDSDTADEVTGYEITGGADQSFFSIDRDTGVLTFNAAPNYEDPQDQDASNTYEVEVQATSGTGDREKTALQAITVTVGDDKTEAPGAPDAPNVSAESVSSLNVSWAAPDNAGPEITDYDVQYRAGTSAPVE